MGAAANRKKVAPSGCSSGCRRRVSPNNNRRGKRKKVMVRGADQDEKRHATGREGKITWTKDTQTRRTRGVLTHADWRMNRPHHGKRNFFASGGEASMRKAGEGESRRRTRLTAFVAMKLCWSSEGHLSSRENRVAQSETVTMAVSPSTGV